MIDHPAHQAVIAAIRKALNDQRDTIWTDGDDNPDTSFGVDGDVDLEKLADAAIEAIEAKP